MPCFVKRGLNSAAKSIDSRQPADVDRIFFAFGIFSACQRTNLPPDPTSCYTACDLWIHGNVTPCLLSCIMLTP